MGTQLRSPKGAQPPPQILTHVCCDQAAGWIKMPLGTEVSLGPGEIVLDVEGEAGSRPTLKNGSSNFRPM